MYKILNVTVLSNKLWVLLWQFLLSSCWV